MRAGQVMVDNSGTQVALFPMEYMYISQGEGGSYSHAGSYAIDFLGWSLNGRMNHCPYYAPFDCHVVQHASYYNVWQSNNPVITPKGKIYVTFVVMHDDNPPPLGTYKNMGEEIGKTGTNTSPGGTPVTGDHLHLDGAVGIFKGWMSGGHDLKNREHLYNLFYINDTIILNDFGYNWKTFNGGVTPNYKKYHFKWVLYSRNLRNRNKNV